MTSPFQVDVPGEAGVSATSVQATASPGSGAGILSPILGVTTIAPIAPNFGNGLMVTTALDASLTISSASSLPVAGRKIGFVHAQDSMGGHKVTFDTTKYLGAGAYQARQGPGQSSYVEFVSNGDGTATLSHIDGIDLREGIRVEDFGATLDTTLTVFSADAVQKAIDYAVSLAHGASYSRPTILLPTGDINLEHPIFIRNSMRILGRGMTSSDIHCKNYVEMPMFIVGGDHTTAGGGNNAPKFVSALVTGAGQALHCGPAADATCPGYDLTQSQWARLPASPWTIDFYFSVDAGALAAQNGSSLFAIAGGLESPYQDSIFKITIDNFSTGQYLPKVFINNGGNISNYAIHTAGVSVIVEGTTYHLEVSWDGTNLRAFLNGVAAVGSPFAPPNTSGAGFVFKNYHQLYLGGGTPLNFGGGINSQYMNHVMDSFQISDNVRHTTGFTPSFAKTAGDTHTNMLLNFDTFLHECMVVKTKGSGGLTGTAYIVPFCITGAQIFEVELSNFAMESGWMYFDAAPFAKIDHIRHYAANGWRFHNGCFELDLNIIQITLPSIGQCAFFASGISEARLANLQLSGPICAILLACNVLVDFMYCSMNSNTFAALVLDIDGTSIFNRFTTDDEAFSTNLIAAVIVQNVQAVQFNASTIISNQAPTGTPAALVRQNVDSSAGQPIVEFNSCFWDTPDTSSPLIDSTGSTHAPSSQATIIRNPFSFTPGTAIIKGPGSFKIELNQAVHAVADADYTAKQGELDISYSSITAARAVTLPALNGTGQPIRIKDESGSCDGTKTITVSVAGGGTIDGAASKVINTAYGKLSVYFNGGQYFTS